MTLRTRRPRAASFIAAIVASLAVVAGALTMAAPAQASHYRADQMTWSASGNTVTFHLSGSFRASFYPPVNPGDHIVAGGRLNFGDGGTTRPDFVVTTVDTANDVLTAEAEVVHTYDTTGPFTAEYADCCRLNTSSHINNNDGNILLRTVIDLTVATASPESTISPIIDCPTNGVCAFNIPAILNSSGATANYRFANPAESGIVNQPGAPYAPNNATISASGNYVWDTTGATVNPATATDPNAPTFYSTQIVIEAVVNGAVVASLPVDFFIRLGSGISNVAPAFVCPTPDDATAFTIDQNAPFTIPVAASDANAGDTVSLAVLGKPTSATFTSTPGNPASGTFAWTPDTLGQTILVLTAQDQFGIQALQRSVTVTVVPAGTAPPLPVSTACATPTPTPAVVAVADVAAAPVLAATGATGEPVALGLGVAALVAGLLAAGFAQLATRRRARGR